MSDWFVEFLFKLSKYLLAPLLFVGLSNAMSDGALARYLPQAEPFFEFASSLVMAAPLAVAGFLLLLGVMLKYFLGYLRARAVRLDATVVEIRQDPFKPQKYRGAEAKFIPRPVVAFTLEGIEHQVPLSSASSGYANMRPGDVLSVLVQPDEPESVDLVSAGRVFPWVMMAVGGFLMAFFTWAMQPGWLAWVLAFVVVLALSKRLYALLQGKLLQA